MSVNDFKDVRVFAGPTGPTGTVKGVHIIANVTGGTGLFPTYNQINASQQGTFGPTGTYESVYPVDATGYAGPTGTFKTIQIVGYTGPA